MPLTFSILIWRALNTTESLLLGLCRESSLSLSCTCVQILQSYWVGLFQRHFVIVTEEDHTVSTSLYFSFGISFIKFPHVRCNLFHLSVSGYLEKKNSIFWDKCNETPFQCPVTAKPVEFSSPEELEEAQLVTSGIEQPHKICSIFTLNPASCLDYPDGIQKCDKN